MAKKKEKKEKTEATPEEKHYIVPLTAVYSAPRPKRARRAITCLKRFVFKHLRIDGKNTLISQKLNQAIWAKGREHIPRKIKIKVIKAEGKANIYLENEKIKKPKKEEKQPKEEKVGPKKSEAEEQEIQRKKEEKKAKEKAAEVTEIKRSKGK